MPSEGLSAADEAYIKSQGLWTDNGQFLTPQPIAERLVRDLQELYSGKLPSEVADFGCGPGALSEAVRASDSTVAITGYELETKALKVYERRFENDPLVSYEERNLLLEPLMTSSLEGIISNPPYLLSRRIGRKLTKMYRNLEHLPIRTGKINTFSLFLQAALDALKPGGVAAFVVPIGVANLGDHHALRNHMKDNCDRIRVTWLVDKVWFAEQGASVDVLLLSFRKRLNTDSDCRLEIMQWDGRSIVWVQEVDGREHEPFPTRTLVEIPEQTGPAITEEFDIVARGFNWDKDWSTIATIDSVAWNRDLLPVVKGGDVLIEGGLREPLTQINYSLLEKHGMLPRTCDFKLHASNRPRLILADITSRIKVAFVQRPVLPMNSVKVIFHQEDNVERLHALLEHLNRPETFRRLKHGRPNLHLTKANLETLRIPE